MREGYLLIATQEQRFADRAQNAARSIRYQDPSRPVCLAHDDCVKPSPEFDLRVRIGRQLRGTEHHLFLNELSPFDHTLYVDSDCLATSARLVPIWDTLRQYHVAFPGRKINSGHWRMDVERACQALGVSYLVQVNGGVFAFDRSPASVEFFRIAQELFGRRPPEITVYHSSGGGIANEPIWSAALALTQSPIFPLKDYLQHSTSKLDGWCIDRSQTVILWKRGQPAEPVFCHFLGMKPMSLYQAWMRRIGAWNTSVQSQLSDA